MDRQEALVVEKTETKRLGDGTKGDEEMMEEIVKRSESIKNYK